MYVQNGFLYLIVTRHKLTVHYAYNRQCFLGPPKRILSCFKSQKTGLLPIEGGVCF
jgi:hypothetical protein